MRRYEKFAKKEYQRIAFIARFYREFEGTSEDDLDPGDDTESEETVLAAKNVVWSLLLNKEKTRPQKNRQRQRNEMLINTKYPSVLIDIITKYANVVTNLDMIEEVLPVWVDYHKGVLTIN